MNNNFLDYDDYLDYIDELRRYHQSQNLEISPIEWAKIVPESMTDVSVMLLDRYEKLEKIKSQIKDDLIEVKDKDELTQMIRETFIEITLAKEAVKIQSEISWLRRFLSNFAENKILINEVDIELAKNVPLENLIPDLKLKSGKLVRCCPFHDEKTPSFTVFKDNHYHCFGCGVFGDVIDYVRQTQNLNFLGAVKYLLKI